MILTLSSCMVSQKSYDAKCSEYDAAIEELNSKYNSMELKEQLLRKAIHDLQLKDRPKEIVPHDPANN